MPGAADTILNYLAAMKAKFNQDEVDKTKLSGLTKIKGASTIRNALAKLKKEGLITVEGKMVVITSKGMDKADTSAFDHIKVPTTNQEKHDIIREELNKKQREVFDALIDGYSKNKEDLRDQLSMEKNSTWRNLLASLVKIKVAEYPTKTTIRLTKDMFPVVDRPEE